MTARVKAIATQEGIPIKHVYAYVRKEAFVSDILAFVVMPPESCAYSAPWRAVVALKCARIIKVVISSYSGNPVNAYIITCT